VDWSPVYTVAMLAFLIGIVFGSVAHKTNFCTMGAVSDWINFGDRNRLRAWLLAIGISILLSQGLHFYGLVELRQSIYLTPKFSWLAYLLGGLLFGIGMTLASGCGQRTLVRLGGGNLKSLVVMVFLGLTAYMTMRGLLAPLRVNATEPVAIDLLKFGISDQGIGSVIAALAGYENPSTVSMGIAVLLGGGLILHAFSSASFRHSFNDVLAGVIVGLIIPAGWYITGVIGFDDFEPVRVESYTFVGPIGESLQYLMTFTGATIDFGVAAVAGVIFGSFIYAIATGKFRLETFLDRADMIRHILGGMLMGFGGVLALGCTVGQGISGMSTLALGSLLTLTAIIFGAALTMKVDYYLMDDEGMLAALHQALSDMKLMPPRRSQ
jgi:uncharacterized membrane protein YedE/YeeE